MPQVAKMTTHNPHTRLIRYRLLSFTLLLSIFSFTFLSCAVTRTVEETVEKTTKSVKDTTRSVARGFKLSDEDLLRRVGIIKFENNSLQAESEFQNIFHKGLPEYLIDQCPGILLLNPAAGGLLKALKEPPKLKLRRYSGG